LKAQKETTSLAGGFHLCAHALRGKLLNPGDDRIPALAAFDAGRKSGDAPGDFFIPADFADGAV